MTNTNRAVAHLVLSCAAAALLVACETTKSENPLSPSVAGPIEGVTISAPTLLEPPQGVKFKEAEQPIKLLIQNATSNGARPVTYTFEVATDTNFATKVFARAGVVPGEGRTSVQIDRLDVGRSYFWRARGDDGANTGSYSSSSFDILPKAVLGAPGLVSPINNERVTTLRPTLTITNSDKNAAIGSISYDFQVALDQAFTQMITSGIVAEAGGGRTTFTAPNDIVYDRTLYWRVRGFDGETTGSWAATQSFRGPATPAPTPSPSPSPTPGAPCTGNTPLSVIECERAKYGHMSSGQNLEFLKNSARSLNAKGFSGGPFGLLRKAGSACGGYSCDIICSGNGSGQRQWDVLGDAEGAQVPSWNGPLPTIRLDTCDVQ